MALQPQQVPHVQTPEERAEAKKNFLFLLVGYVAFIIICVNVIGAISAFSNVASDLPIRFKHTNDVAMTVFLGVTIFAAGFYYCWKGFHLNTMINRTAYFVGSTMILSVLWNIALLIVSFFMDGSPEGYVLLGIAFLVNAVIGTLVYFFRKY